MAALALTHTDPTKFVWPDITPLFGGGTDESADAPVATVNAPYMSCANCNGKKPDIVLIGTVADWPIEGKIFRRRVFCEGHVEGFLSLNVFNY